MIVQRAIQAHVAAVLAGSLILMVGVRMIASGVDGALVGVAGWLGGVLIFGVLAVASIPAGLVVRWVVGQVPVRPVLGAVMGGMMISVLLVFVLYRGLFPNVSLMTAPFSLLAVHAVAGGVGGWIWHAVEFGAKGSSDV